MKNKKKYIENSSLVNYNIDLNECTHPNIKRIFDYGIVWPGGAGGWFLVSSTLQSLGCKEHFWTDEKVNEYHPITSNYFSQVDNMTRRCSPTNVVLETLSNNLYDLEDTTQDRKSQTMKGSGEWRKETIFCSHWLPVLIFSKTNIHVKHLTYIRYNNWIRRCLIHIKRLLKADASLTSMAFLLGEFFSEVRNNPRFLQANFTWTAEEINIVLDPLINNYPKIFKIGEFVSGSPNREKRYILYFYIFWCIKEGFDMYDHTNFSKYLLSLFTLYKLSSTEEMLLNIDNDECNINIKEQQAIDYIKSTGKVDHFEVRDYDDLFFDLNTNLPISKTKIIEYSKKNLELIDTMTTYIPDGTIKKELYIEFDQYNNRMKKALHEPI